MNRRRFILGTTGLAAAASAGRLAAQTPASPAIRTVRTRVLEIGYHESGDPAGFPVVLLHGFPDDAHAYDGVAPLLARAGYRALAVYLRGFGPTRFRAPPSRRRSARTSSI
jgi:pimeloyl-ACP methyl ester carboxylesterase